MQAAQSERPGSALPRYLTPIIGREQAIEDIERLLTQSRVVTIVGAGGIGKTRVAVEVAGLQSDEESCFIDLEPLSDPALVTSRVAVAVGAELRGSVDPTYALISLLEAQRVLLVLDNCEHLVVEVRDLVERIITSCEHVRVLATSREPLGVNDESAYRLSTLDDAAGVALFVERARQSDVTFAPSADDAAVIKNICRRLDGIALAIELAAGCLAHRPPKALLVRLKERFRLLAGGKKNARRHHQTLRALIDWSYELLSEDEATVFARLGVFNGEFSLDAATRVVKSSPETIVALLHKSMIVPSTHAAHRYRMLESIREYALLHLHESADEERTRRAHAAYFAEVSADAAARFGNDSEETWLARYEPDLDNFRAALDWSLRFDRDVAAPMLGNLKEYWFHSNLITEGLSRSQALLAALPLDDDRALPPLLAVATLAWRAGDNRTSFEAGQRALDIAVRTGNLRAIAAARYSLGWALFKLGDTERATAELHDALECYYELQEPLRALLAEIDYAISLKRADPRRGRELLEHALPAARASGWPRTIMRIATGLTEYAFLDGEVARAIALGREALATARTGRSAYALSVALVNLSSYLSVAGEHEEAAAIAREAIGFARTHGIHIVVEWALQNLAIDIARKGDSLRAAQLFGHVDAFIDEVGAGREPTEEAVKDYLLALLREQLDAPALEDAIIAGRGLTLQEACVCALDLS